MSDDYRMLTGGDEGERVSQLQALGRTVGQIHHAFSPAGELVVIEFVDGYGLALETTHDQPGELHSTWLDASQVLAAIG